MTAAGGIAALLLVVSFITDIRSRKIPNWLTAGGTAAGAAVHAIADGWSGLGFAAAGFACGFVPLLLLYACRAVGAGDVKLFGALGALTGTGFVLYAMAASLLFAGLLAACILLWKQDWVARVCMLGISVWHLAVRKDWTQIREWREGAEQKRYTQFPFMWAVLPGTLYALWQWSSV